MGIDSVVLQVSIDSTDLHAAKRIEAILAGKLEILKSAPIRPTADQVARWKHVMGRALPKTAVFIALLHHERGQSIPMLRYGNGKGLQLHFHGLQQYEKRARVLNDGAIQRRAILDEFMAGWDEPVRLSRFDRSIDLIGKEWKEYSNTRDHRTLCKKHGAAQFEKTTIYYQPPKPQYVKVTAYDKQVSNKSSYPLTRIEFSFKGQYWRNSEALSAMEMIETATLKADAYIRKVSRALSI